MLGKKLYENLRSKLCVLILIFYNEHFIFPFPFLTPPELLPISFLFCQVHIVDMLL